MDAKQQAHVKMIITSGDVLDLNKPLWETITDFAAARAGLGAIVDAILEAEKKQADTTVGGTQDKRVARGLMCDAAGIVGGAVAAWADKQDDHETFVKVDFSAADLLHMPEQDCLTNCKNIFDTGTANLAAIAAGKTLAQADLADLDDKITNFKNSFTRPRQIRGKISGATSQIPALIDSADRLLERQIDRLMERFKNTQPDFYAAYQVARVIVDQGGGGGSGTPPAPTAPPAK